MRRRPRLTLLSIGLFGALGLANATPPEATPDSPDGRYGRWNMTGIATYIVGILVQIPFLSTAFYTGPLVEPLGEADVSWILGLIVPAALYYVLARNDTARIPGHLILAEPAATH